MRTQPGDQGCLDGLSAVGRCRSEANSPRPTFDREAVAAELVAPVLILPRGLHRRQRLAFRSLGAAELRGEQQQAMEYLDRAGELFSRYGAKLYLDQVLARKQILKA